MPLRRHAAPRIGDHGYYTAAKRLARRSARADDSVTIASDLLSFDPEHATHFQRTQPGVRSGAYVSCWLFVADEEVTEEDRHVE